MLEVARPPRLPLGVPAGRVTYIVAVAAVEESDLINVNYGDRAGPDSRGLFQQRTSWGTLAQRMDPVYATRTFLLGPGHNGTGGLLDLRDWTKLPVTMAIHRVQINAVRSTIGGSRRGRAEIGAQAGVDFDAPRGKRPRGQRGSGSRSMPERGPSQRRGDRATDRQNRRLPARHDVRQRPANAHDCNQAIAINETRDDQRQPRLAQTLPRPTGAGLRLCTLTAFLGAQIATAAGRISTDRTGIPRGAVLWWTVERPATARAMSLCTTGPVTS